MKKICIIGPALKMGGIERESVNFANSLPTERLEVSFVALFKLSHFFQLNSSIGFYEPSGFNEKKLHLVKTLKWVRKTIFNINPDGIIVYNKFYAALVSLALLGSKYQIFVSEASSPLYKWGFKQGFINRLAFSLKPPKGVKAQTHVSLAYLKRYYSHRTKFQVIPNPLRDIQTYPEVEKKPWILGVGRFGDPLKGFDRLIQAFAKIQESNWSLVFAGGDEDGGYLKEEAAKLGVLNRIKFLGQVKDIDLIYAQASIFVMPSRSEGFPNALCEAMGAGLPCVSFDFVSGPRDMINDGENGILVKDGDINALAAEIQALINDEEKRKTLGKNASHIRLRLDQDKIAHELAEFILGDNSNN